jgi:D-xylose 1-dehydrogenase (NADP+, D-xylono-1,5-lactone-forming)
VSGPAAHMALRWGLLSTARINDKLVAGARSTDEAEVVAVASRDGDRARAWADERGIERAHGSYEALLEDPGVDAVYISLPNALHVPWSLLALGAGKHVLCEKPLTRRPEEAEAAFDAAEARGLQLAEAFMWRHHPQARRLRTLVEEGAIGTLRLVRGVFSFPLSDHGNVRMVGDLEGGALMDVGCYCVSGARLLAGAEPERAYGEQVLGGAGVDIAFAGTLRFPGEVLAQFDCAFTVGGRDELEAIGDAGSLFLDDPWHSLEPVIELHRDGAVEHVEAERANPYGCELADFARAVRGEAPPLLGRADALGQARAIAALYRAADTGAPVAIAPG